MRRRDFLTWMGAGAAGLLAREAFGQTGGGGDQRPNILWITAEDMSANLGCYGDTYAKAPNLDRFAAQAVRFDRAFATAGVCAPARSCLITGMYPSSLGSQHMRSMTELPPEAGCFTQWLRKAGYYCSNNAKQDYNFKTPADAWDESGGQAHWRKRNPGQPFFSVFNFMETHEGQIRAEPFNLRHDPAEAPVPPFHPDTPEVRRDWARYYDLITTMDAKAGQILRQLESDGLAEDTIVFFYGDHGVGLPRGKRWLYETGMHVPLLVRFPQKYRHLAPAAPGGSTGRLVSFVDFGPTVLSLAGVPVPEAMQGVPFLGAQAGPPRQYVFGHRDRMDERYDFTRAVRDERYRYIRNFMPHRPHAQPIAYMDLMPTMQVWRHLAAEGKLEGPPALFMRPHKDAEELYDLQTDPHELHNLAALPEHRQTLERMRGALRDWMLQTRDLGLLPEAQMHRRAAGEAPYTMARRAERFDPARLLAAADRLPAGTAALPELIEGLTDADAGVRYWSATALAALGAPAAPAEASLSGALSDECPNVRIAAAEALGRLDRHDLALPVLVQSLRDPDEYVRLHAANVLDLCGAAAAPAQAEIQRLAKDKSRQVADTLAHLLRTLAQP